MSSYSPTEQDQEEFEMWWDEQHCEGDSKEDTTEYQWAREAFIYGMRHSHDLVTLSPREQDSYEETIREITRVNMELRQEVAELEVSRETKFHPDLPAKLEKEITVLREQKEGLVLAVTALSDVLAQEVL